MTTLHALRRTYALSFSDLAMLTAIPARRLAGFEYQGHPLSSAERSQIALFFGVAAHTLEGGYVAQSTARPAFQPVQAHVLALLAATAALAWGLRFGLSNMPSVSSYGALQPVAPPPAEASRPDQLITTLVPSPANPTATPPPVTPSAVPPTRTPTPTEQVAPRPPSRTLAQRIRPTTPAALPTAPANVPQRCPLMPEQGSVVLTQGYAVGTHAPAAQWGALDLAVRDGATAGAAIVATHAGKVTVTLNSWPGGNFVSVSSDAGWRTGYAHLQTVFVQTGDVIEAGTPLGTAGSTGYATGPHLHYETWRDGMNVDPAPVLFCADVEPTAGN